MPQRTEEILKLAKETEDQDLVKGLGGFFSDPDDKFRSVNLMNCYFNKFDQFFRSAISYPGECRFKKIGGSFYSDNMRKVISCSKEKFLSNNSREYVKVVLGDEIIRDFSSFFSKGKWSSASAYAWYSHNFEWIVYNHGSKREDQALKMTKFILSMHNKDFDLLSLGNKLLYLAFENSGFSSSKLKKSFLEIDMHDVRVHEEAHILRKQFRGSDSENERNSFLHQLCFSNPRLALRQCLFSTFGRKVPDEKDIYYLAGKNILQSYVSIINDEQKKGNFAEIDISGDLKHSVQDFYKLSPEDIRNIAKRILY